MNNQNTENAPKVLKESKNKIKVDFERTNIWTRLKIKFLSVSFLGNLIWWIFRLVLLLGISYVILVPFFSKIASSFMSSRDFVDATVKLIPRYPTLATYKAVIIDSDYIPALINTTIISLLAGISQTFICCMIGYGLAKYKFKGNGILTALVVFTMVVPHGTLRLSMFMNFRYFDIAGIFNFLGGGVFEGLRILDFSSINLINTYWPMVILSITGLGFKNGLYIFMMRQFFRNVPDELEESAYIDGSGIFRTFLQIVLPISIPMMITVFLFSFSWQWTDNFYTQVFFTTSGLKLMPSIVQSAPTSNTSGSAALEAQAYLSTCGLMIILPLIILFLFCQKYLVQGIERSGITG